MPLLTGYTQKGWRLSQTVRPEGFTVDRAEIDYLEIDEDTFVAVGEIFNSASTEDTVDVTVTLDGQEIHLFRGRVIDWSLGEDPATGMAMATLVVEDELGRLLDMEVPRGLVFEAGCDALSIIRRLAQLAGIAIATDGVPSYMVGPDLSAAPGMKLGEMIARLLQPMQQVRRTRVDFFRTGPGQYRLAKRPGTLGAGLEVPRSAVKLRRFRRSYVPPVEDAEVFGHAPPTSELESPVTPAIAARNGCATGFPDYSVVFPEDIKQLEPVTKTFPYQSRDALDRIVIDGELRVTYLANREIGSEDDKLIYTYPPAPDPPVVKRVVTVQTPEYDGDGRLRSVLEQRFEDNTLVGETKKTNTYDVDGRLVQEGTSFRELLSIHPYTGEALDPPQLFETRLESLVKIPVGEGHTRKLAERWRLDTDLQTDQVGFVSEGAAMETSPGDSRPGDEPTKKWFTTTIVNRTENGGWVYRQGRWTYRDELVGDPIFAALIAEEAEAQGDSWLLEVELEMPLDLRIRPHMVIDFTGGGVVAQARFFITEVNVRDSGTATMQVFGEVYLPSVGGVQTAGTLAPRAGMAFLGARRAAARETVALMHGLVTRVNVDGSAQVFVPEEGVVYPHILPHPSAGGRVVLPRDQLIVERRGLVLWAIA